MGGHTLLSNTPGSQGYRWLGMTDLVWLWWQWFVDGHVSFMFLWVFKMHEDPQGCHATFCTRCESFIFHGFCELIKGYTMLHVWEMGAFACLCAFKLLTRGRSKYVKCQTWKILHVGSIVTTKKPVPRPQRASDPCGVQGRAMYMHKDWRAATISCSSCSWNEPETNPILKRKNELCYEWLWHLHCAGSLWQGNSGKNCWHKIPPKRSLSLWSLWSLFNIFNLILLCVGDALEPLEIGLWELKSSILRFRRITSSMISAWHGSGQHLTHLPFRFGEVLRCWQLLFSSGEHRLRPADVLFGVLQIQAQEGKPWKPWKSLPKEGIQTDRQTDRPTDERTDWQRDG